MSSSFFVCPDLHPCLLYVLRVRRGDTGRFGSVDFSSLDEAVVEPIFFFGVPLRRGDSRLAAVRFSDSDGDVVDSDNSGFVVVEDLFFLGGVTRPSSSLEDSNRFSPALRLRLPVSRFVGVL